MNDFVSKRWDPNSYQNCQLCTHPTSHRTMHWHKQEQNLTATIPFPWPKVRVTQLRPRSEVQTQNHPPQEHQMIMHGTTATNKRVSSLEKMMMYSTSFYFEKELWTPANFTSLFLFFFPPSKISQNCYEEPLTTCSRNDAKLDMFGRSWSSSLKASSAISPNLSNGSTFLGSSTLESITAAAFPCLIMGTAHSTMLAGSQSLS